MDMGLGEGRGTEDDDVSKIGVERNEDEDGVMGDACAMVLSEVCEKDVVTDNDDVDGLNSDTDGRVEKDETVGKAEDMDAKDA